MGHLKIHSSVAFCKYKSLDYVHNNNKIFNFKLNELPVFSETTKKLFSDLLNNKTWEQGNTKAHASQAFRNKSVLQILPSSLKAAGQLALGMGAVVGLETAAPHAKDALINAIQAAADYVPTEAVLTLLSSDKKETENNFETQREVEQFGLGMRTACIAALLALTTVNLFTKRNETQLELDKLKIALHKQTWFLRNNAKTLSDTIENKLKEELIENDREIMEKAKTELTAAIKFHNSLRKSDVYDYYASEESSYSDGDYEPEGAYEEDGDYEAGGAYEAEGDYEAEGAYEAEGEYEADEAEAEESSDSAESSSTESKDSSVDGQKDSATGADPAASTDGLPVTPVKTDSESQVQPNSPSQKRIPRTPIAKENPSSSPKASPVHTPKRNTPHTSPKASPVHTPKRNTPHTSPKASPVPQTKLKTPAQSPKADKEEAPSVVQPETKAKQKEGTCIIS